MSLDMRSCWSTPERSKKPACNGARCVILDSRAATCIADGCKLAISQDHEIVARLREPAPKVESRVMDPVHRRYGQPDPVGMKVIGQAGGAQCDGLPGSPAAPLVGVTKVAARRPVRLGASQIRPETGTYSELHIFRPKENTFSNRVP